MSIYYYLLGCKIRQTTVGKELQSSGRGRERKREGDRLTTITTPDEGVWKKCCRGCWTGLERWTDGRGAAVPQSQKGDEEGGKGMDHLTDPSTVAAAVVCCRRDREGERGREIEVGDWGEGGIGEKLFWPLQWGRAGGRTNCSAALLVGRGAAVVGFAHNKKIH